jgi:hypothetical protein
VILRNKEIKPRLKKHNKTSPETKQTKKNSTNSRDQLGNFVFSKISFVKYISQKLLIGQLTIIIVTRKQKNDVSWPKQFIGGGVYVCELERKKMMTCSILLLLQYSNEHISKPANRTHAHSTINNRSNIE